MENTLFKDFGTFLNTSNMEQYEINKVVIFQDNKIKMIANYFLDNFSNYKTTINGEIKRKLKVDFSNNYNFVVKSEKQDSWRDNSQYTLYINGDLNGFIFEGLELNGTQLNAIYLFNNIKCSQCIGWNEKESNKIRYHKYQEIYKELDYYCDNEKAEEKAKELLKTIKDYKKAKEIENNYTPNDYKKMNLCSGTDLKENLTILKNNGFDIEGVEK